mgnify:CR=1 FL=1
MWRPKDWKNPHFITRDLGEGPESWNSYPRFDDFEKGAGAILQALFEAAEDSPTGTFVIDSNLTRL